MTVVGRIVSIPQLPTKRRVEMYQLMMRHYEHVRRDSFDADLDEKDWVLEISETETGALCGFSTQMLLHAELDGEQLTALYSGDTIVDPSYRHRNPLAGLWGRLALELIDQFTGETLYWFLISKGYKTYRFLPLFFHDFHPRYDRPMPIERWRLIDAFGQRKFGDAYDTRRQIVPAQGEACRLRPGAAELTKERMADQHVAFFASRNPGHAAGDELCCVAPLTHENFTPAAWKVIGQTGGPFRSEALARVPVR